MTPCAIAVHAGDKSRRRKKTGVSGDKLFRVACCGTVHKSTEEHFPEIDPTKFRRIKERLELLVSPQLYNIVRTLGNSYRITIFKM